MWNVVEADDGSLHVVPDKDLVQHALRFDCWCKPYEDIGVAEMVVMVHNSADCREDNEHPSAAGTMQLTKRC